VSLKRASYWQFNNIYEKLKSLHTSIKYNHKLIREKDKEIDHFKTQIKAHGRVR